MYKDLSKITFAIHLFDQAGSVGRSSVWFDTREGGLNLILNQVREEIYRDSQTRRVGIRDSTKTTGPVGQAIRQDIQ